MDTPSEHDRERFEREQTDTRNLQELVDWLEYGRESGYKAARCSEKQEHYWADLLKSLIKYSPKKQ